MKSANHTKKRANQNVCWGRACCLVQNGFSRKSSLSSQNVPRSAWIAGGCVGHCFKKAATCKIEVFQCKELLERIQIAQKTQLTGNFSENVAHKSTTFRKISVLVAKRLTGQPIAPQNGASEHAKYRQVAPDTLQRASGADAGQSPTVSVRCHFWSASGSGAG